MNLDTKDTEKSSQHASFIMLFLVVALPILYFVLHNQNIIPKNSYVNPSLHSATEATSAFILLIMGFILSQRNDEDFGMKYSLLSMGFLGSGVVSLFHAISGQTNLGVFLYCLSNIWCALCFSLTALGKINSRFLRNQALLWIVLFGSVIIAFLASLFPHTLPTMIIDTEFTSPAKTTNTVAGILFTVAALNFILEYHHGNKAETALFAGLTLLFAASGLTFKHSSLWNNEWWTWHILRIFGSLIVLTAIINNYLTILMNYKSALKERNSMFQELQKNTTELEATNQQLLAAMNHLQENSQSLYDTLNDLADKEKRLESAQRIGRLGDWEYHVEKQKFNWSKQVFRLYERPLSAGTPATLPEYLELFLPEDARQLNDCFQRALDFEEETSGDFQLKTVHEHALFQHIIIRPMKNKQDQLVKLQGIVQDITARKKLENTIQEAADIKAKFIAMASHELRTPLTTIKEAVDLITEGVLGEVSEKQTRLLHITQKNIRRLALMVNDILDFQKLQAGKMKFHFNTTNINTIVHDVYTTMYSLVEQKQLFFKLDLGKNIPDSKMDKDKIIQVILNLINNALKFTDHGGITVTTKKTKGNSLIVRVQDTGHGIKNQDIPKLFHSFEQLEYSDTSKPKGTGLGLAICKEIIMGHNGKIWAQAEPGEGSTFSFEIPVKTK